MPCTFTALMEQALDDSRARLVLADALEEHGEDQRARLVRMLDEYERCEDQRERLLSEAGDLSWLGEPLKSAFEAAPALAMGPAVLLPFLVAEVAVPEGGPIQAGSSWRGMLWQYGQAIRATLRLNQQEGCRVSGVLNEDFGLIYPGSGLTGAFHFAGVAVGKAVAFIVSEVVGFGASGGIYHLRLGRAGWLSGSWWVPPHDFRGSLHLRRAQEAE